MLGEIASTVHILNEVSEIFLLQRLLHESNIGWDPSRSIMVHQGESIIVQVFLGESRMP